MGHEFLSESGAVFTKKPPAKGLYFDFGSGEIKRSETGHVVMTLQPGGRRDAPLPLFSTNISRRAGNPRIWGAEHPLRVHRKIWAIQKQFKEVEIRGTEAIDMIRFFYEIKQMVMVDLRKLVVGYVHSKTIEAGGGSVDFFCLAPQRANFTYFSDGTIDLLKADLGTAEFSNRVEGFGCQDLRAAPFMVDRGSGLLLQEGGAVVGHGFPRSKKGGVAFFTKWEAFPGFGDSSLVFPQKAGGVVAAWRIPGSKAVLNIDKVSGLDRKQAVMEALNGVCCLDGPQRLAVLRARAVVFGKNSNFSMNISTRGVDINSIPEGQWGGVKQSEVAKVGIFLQNAGLPKLATEALKKERAKKKSRGLEGGRWAGAKLDSRQH